MLSFRILSAALVGVLVSVLVSFERDGLEIERKEFRFAPAPDFGLEQALAEIRSDLAHSAKRKNSAALLDAMTAAASSGTSFPLDTPAAPESPPN